MDGRSVVVAVTTAGDKAIAGPLVAAAIVLSSDTAEPRFTWSGSAGRRSFGVTQADLIPEGRRQQISAWLKKHALGFSLVVCTPRQLSEVPPRIARQAAVGRAVVRAVEHAKFRYEGTVSTDGHVMVGGTTPVLKRYAGSTRQELYRGRDTRPWPVWAAYLLARAHRDTFMVTAAAEFPEYEFAVNFGYASGAHRDALESLGPTRHHRRTTPLVRDLETA